MSLTVAKITAALVSPFVKWALVAALIAGYSWFWYNQGHNARDRQALQEQVAAQEAADKKRQEVQDRLDDVSERLQNALNNVRVETRYIDRVITKEIEKPIYRECVVPDTGTTILNDNADRLNRLRK